MKFIYIFIIFVNFMMNKKDIWYFIIYINKYVYVLELYYNCKY